MSKTNSKYTHTGVGCIVVAMAKAIASMTTFIRVSLGSSPSIRKESSVQINDQQRDRTK